MPSQSSKVRERENELLRLRKVTEEPFGIYVAYPRTVSRGEAWLHLASLPPFELADSPHNPWRKLHTEKWGWYIPKLKLADQKLIEYEVPPVVAPLGAPSLSKPPVVTEEQAKQLLLEYKEHHVDE